jgi:HEAT repeat protein
LLATPIAALARAGNAVATARFDSMLAHDPMWPVRARAAELAVDVPATEDALVKAAQDGEPRVREAALRSLGAARSPKAAQAAAAALSSDPWTFVRVAAATALGALPATLAADGDRALEGALEDTSPRVRAAAISSLAAHGASSATRLLTLRMDDRKEDLDVRVAATRALGRLCAANAADRLTKLADAAASPVADETETELGIAAIDALGKLHPPDLGKRLAKARGQGVHDEVRRAAEASLAEAGSCRK